VTALFLADTSAWHRATHRAIADEWGRKLVDDQLATCSQVRLEILFSARSVKEYEQLSDELEALHELPCGHEQFERALEVQHALAKRHALHHRSVKIPVLIIAACAEAGGATIWHYDEDFDRIAKITGQAVEWIAPRGSL
jgi:predicted nucleic acid-binding protein